MKAWSIFLQPTTGKSFYEVFLTREEADGAFARHLEYIGDYSFLSLAEAHFCREKPIRITQADTSWREVKV